MQNRDNYVKLILECLRNRAPERLRQAIQQAGTVLGWDELNRLMCHEVLPSVSSDQRRWFVAQLPEEKQACLKQECARIMVEMLTKAGFQFGKDFSAYGDGLMVSDQCQAFLMSRLPENKRDAFEQDLRENGGLLTIEQNPARMLEAQLGTPFFDNLLKLAKQRAAALDDIQLADYLGNIIAGVLQRHPEFDWFPDWLIDRTLSKERQAKMLDAEGKDDEESRENVDWLLDLIRAANGEAEIQSLEGRCIVTKKGLHLLSLVYEG